MLLAPTLTERVILPAAWDGSYFFNRIGQKRTLRDGSAKPVTELNLKYPYPQ